MSEYNEFSTIRLMTDQIPVVGKPLNARTSSFKNVPERYARFQTSPLSSIRSLSPGVYEVETTSGGRYQVVVSAVI